MEPPSTGISRLSMGKSLDHEGMTTNAAMEIGASAMIKGFLRRRIHTRSLHTQIRGTPKTPAMLSTSSESR